MRLSGSGFIGSGGPYEFPSIVEITLKAADDLGEKLCRPLWSN